MAKAASPKKLKLFNHDETPVLLFFFLASLSVILMSLDNKFYLNASIRDYGNIIHIPIQSLINFPERTKKRFDFYFSKQEKLINTIDELENKINVNDINLQNLELLKNENANLRKLLNLKEIVRQDIQIAEIILPNHINGKAQIFIDKGSNQNIDVGSAVMNHRGLIGQVIHVENNTSKIMSTNSNQFAVSAVTNQGLINTVIFGTGQINLEIQRLPMYEKIKVGDVFLTSGLDSIYPKGIKIGKVTQIIATKNDQFKKIIITPFSDPKAYSQVMIIKND